MITIQSAENALKNIYLESIVNDINTKTNPFLTMLEKNVKTVASKEARATIRYGNEASVITGAEGGAVPKDTNATSAEIVTPLKNLYGSFQISDKAMRASQNSPGAYASLLSGEMQNLISTAQQNLNAMLYGNGKKLLGYGDNYNTTEKKITMNPRFIDNFQAGIFLEVYNANNQKLNQQLFHVASVDKDTNVVTFNGIIIPNKFDRLYFYQTNNNDQELNGIDSIFFADTMYNLELDAHKKIAPCIFADTSLSGTLQVLNEDAIMNFFDAYEEHCQGMPADILLTHPNVRKAVFENLRDLRSNVDVTDLAGGFKGFSFNGVPVYADLKCKAGTLYALNSNSWNMHQLCDWTWLSGDDGSILKQMDGRAGYSATLVKYADLICDKPFIQGKVTNYSATRTK